jgi:hypothetical protein
MNIAIITIDSLRYDVAISSHLPNFNILFKKHGIDNWAKVFAHGTYTLVSHISIFQGGILPEIRKCGLDIYDRDMLNAFRVILPWERNKKALYPVPESPNLVKGFEKLGYETIGIGGVTWFMTNLATTNLWKDQYFSRFYWHDRFHSTNPKAFHEQIKFSRNLLFNYPPNKKLFFFLNIPSTHIPYMNFGNNMDAQVKALEEVDKLFPELIDLIPKPCHFFIMSDHGECFGENGLWGHGFYHPKVMEIPMVNFIIYN